MKTGIELNWTSEGANLDIYTAICELCTNAIDEALEQTVTKVARVSAGIVDSTSFPFLKPGKYVVVADSGEGIDFEEFFRNGNPNCFRKNHRYHKGVVRSFSRFDPEGGGRFVIVRRCANGFSVAEGNVLNEYEEYSLNECKQLSESFNTWIFALIDEDDCELDTLDNFSEYLRAKYHYYLVENPQLVLTWNDEKIEPLEFIMAQNEGHVKYYADFGEFALEIDKFRAPSKDDGESSALSQRTYNGFIEAGGIAFYHEGLLIQDALFHPILKRSQWKTLMKALNNVKGNMTEREALMEKGVALADCLWERGPLNVPKNGIEKNRGSMNALRYLVNIKTKDGFCVPTDDTKTKFKWTPEFKQIMLALNSVIGDDVRDTNQKRAESEVRSNVDTALEFVEKRTHGKIKYRKEVHPSPKSALRIDGVLDLSELGLPPCLIEFKAETVVSQDAAQLIRYHMRYSDSHESEFPIKNGVMLTPSMSLVFAGNEFSDDVIEDLRCYQSLLKKLNRSVEISLMILHKDGEGVTAEFVDI